MAPPRTRAELLHRGGTAATWGNLGLWPAADYAAAGRALARRVGEAAALAPGQRVLSLACGAGDELRCWVDGFGVARATGIDRGGDLAAPGDPRITLHRGDALAAVPGAPDVSFDAVLCVDAAYHLSPRPAFIAHAFARLRPGGRLAFTDLVLDHHAGPLLRVAARLCGVPAADLADAATREAQLRAAGFNTVRHERLDDAVLGGFVRFVQQQRGVLGRDAWSPAWRGVAVTAALIPPCRAAGLGYALFSAGKPLPSRAATS